MIGLILGICTQPMFYSKPPVKIDLKPYTIDLQRQLILDEIERQRKLEEERKRKEEEERKRKEEQERKKKKTTNVSKDTMKQYAYKLVKEQGWSDNDYNNFVKIVQKESGWKVTAKNKKSGAYGLCQSLPASKMAKYGSDYKTNYKTQLKWCINYVKQRYGNPTNALNFWNKHKWF